MPWSIQPMPQAPGAGSPRSHRTRRAQGHRHCVATSHRQQFGAQAQGQSGQIRPRRKECAQGIRRPTGNHDLALLALAKNEDVFRAGNRADEPTHGTPLRHGAVGENQKTQPSVRRPCPPIAHLQKQTRQRLAPLPSLTFTELPQKVKSTTASIAAHCRRPTRRARQVPLRHPIGQRGSPKRTENARPI